MAIATADSARITADTIWVSADGYYGSMYYDFHDGGGFRTDFEDERKAKAERKKHVQDLYERVIEGRTSEPVEIAQLVAPYVRNPASDAPSIDWDKMLRSVDRAQALRERLIALDDEDVLQFLI
jgi:hypothetical protein